MPFGYCVLPPDLSTGAVDCEYAFLVIGAFGYEPVKRSGRDVVEHERLVAGGF
jgi:hypothetical protein